jgi:hypothetical protein
MGSQQVRSPRLYTREILAARIYGVCVSFPADKNEKYENRRYLFIVVFHSLLSQMAEYYLKLDMADSFYILSNSLFTNNPVI